MLAMSTQNQFCSRGNLNVLPYIVVNVNPIM